MARQKLFLLDAMALLYRAHFAFIKNPRVTSQGLNTSAVFGFVNTLLEIINKENPTHLGVAFDTSKPTFRHEQYEPYKANREAMPEDLSAAIPYAYKLLEVLDIPALKLDGYEADDIIGTISAKVEADVDVYMVTPDKDYAQLVKENVFLYKPAYRGGGFDVMGIEEVKEKFGLPPSQIVDFLGLKGDAVDNIPGIPKIGDKSAVALLTEYGSVEEIIARVDEITKKSWQKTVREHAEQGLLSKELAKIHLEVPIEWSLDRLKIGHCDLEALLTLMTELEFKTTAQRILNSPLNPMRPDQQRDLFGQVVEGDIQFDLPSASGEIKTIEDKETSYVLLETPEARQEWIDKIKAAGHVCFDTETTGLDPLQADIVGLSLSVKAGEAAFVYFTPEDTEEDIKAVLEEFMEVLQSDSILKIGQNLKYDFLVLLRYGFRASGPMFDTMLAHYVIDPGGKHGMDALAEEFLHYKPISIETLIGKKGKKQKTMRDVPLEDLVPYACEDADITLQLWEILAPKVKDNKVFETIEQPLMPILTDM
ncbi:MAG: 5'-3' exonuclease H3TH domain-containing protein, partial [Bacteroidota bacterium]